MIKPDTKAITLALIKKKFPETQAECCLLAARVSVATMGPPRTEEDYMQSAHGLAAGLFGPAFETADVPQRWKWIDMCEAALRQAAREKPHEAPTR